MCIIIQRNTKFTKGFRVYFQFYLSVLLNVVLVKGLYQLMNLGPNSKIKISLIHSVCVSAHGLGQSKFEIRL